MKWRAVQETCQVCRMICRLLCSLLTVIHDIFCKSVQFHQPIGDEVLSLLLLARLACNVAFLGEMTLPRTRLVQVYKSYHIKNDQSCIVHYTVVRRSCGARAPRVSAAPSGATWEYDIAWFDLCVHLWFSGLLPTNNTSTIPDVVENLFF